VDGAGPSDAVISSTPPASPAGFRASWQKLGAKKRLLLAVSGGSDSMALMRLAAPLARNGEAEITVASVDHGLRRGSRSEAEAVGSAARSLGLSHEILNWTGEKPSSGLQAAARAARYGLLVRYAIARGADAIMTAHTADDQAETFFMRLARGSGPRGLSAMAPSSLIAAGASAPISLLRPVLGERRIALRAFLAKENARFLDDPSNEDTSFERVRVRTTLVGLEASGALRLEALVETADQMRAAADRLELAENERLRALGGFFDPFGGASLAAAADGSDASLIARLIGAVAGSDYAPAPAKAAAALSSALEGRDATLSGALVSCRGGRLMISREPAAVLGRQGAAPLAPVVLAPGKKMIFDARFIAANLFAEPALLRPVGREEARRYGDIGIASPVFEIGGEIVAIPGETEAFQPLAAERFYQRVNRFP